MPLQMAYPPMILVVEDLDHLRLEVVDLFQDAGFDTMEAENADVALEMMKVRTRDVSVLFTDVQMPGELDGVDLAREFDRRWPDVLLMVTSGEVALSDGDLPQGGHFILKPYRAAAAILQVRQLIERGHRH